MIFSVELKSATTPSFNGFLATIFPGVLPKIFLASFPTEIIFELKLFIATTEGSFNTTPLFGKYTRTDAVPKSIAIFLRKFILSPINLFYSICRHC